ncbi:class I SAM-dependent methyltransferase [Pontibacter arcticus]|uniref:Class I SAM-dependent methyltransferase n=1 Tax=Pontibacter arcticus TaxID=2080288 RepID=A0A364RHE0_9BACT|nr:class I SAM-dependent methyltransferase [Pontibacter arcticus]RAU83702.1 class I SAM-dependent methyltransferase [Pontibacter arcticus]
MNFRLHLFELEDQPWFPHVLRQGMLDFLRFMINRLHAYEAAIPLLASLLRKTNTIHFTDLGSGAGGGIESIQKALSRQVGQPVQVTLSDLYPNLAAYTYLKEKSGGKIDFIPASVNATSVPESITGVRTIFSSFHHFSPKQAKAILQDAAEKKQIIGVFEGASKSWLELLVLWFGFPIAIFFITPFIRPFRFSRLFFTYLVPLIPLGIIWDGTVSLFRIYTPAMLQQMVASIQVPGYTWQTGKVGNRFGKYVIYVIGYPDETMVQE